MFTDKIHRTQPHCPVCGFEGAGEPAKGFARNTMPGYLIALASGIGVSPETIVEPLKDRICMRCGTVYVNPALSDAAVGRLFLNHASVHSWGWGRFTKKLLSDPPELGEVEALEAYIRSEVGLPERYLEVGCPFGGFAIMWSDGARIREAATSGGGQDPDFLRGYRRLLKINLALSALFVRISNVITRFWLTVNRFKKRTTSPLTMSPETAVELAFLGQFSMNQWSFGCRAFGMTCTEMASRGMKAEVLSLARLKELPDDNFELAGIINSLDHSDSPLELLREVARVSNKVVVSGHRLIDAHLQHRFAFSDETLPRLAAELRLSCRDISSGLRGHSTKWFAFILAKQ